ncbi:MAG: hypothetical protein Q9219_007623 [cf. Caloplaca sp. 3 TL-2023]
MHLLNTSTCKVYDFLPAEIPSYVILSHRWEDEEVSYRDLTEPKQDPSMLKGWTKLHSFCSLVGKDGWEWVWMDTCCIDKSSSSEVSEAINSMFQWYNQAAFCIAYLADISIDDTSSNARRFGQSAWFSRGWTLQELLASPEVIFYDRKWKTIGTRTRLAVHVSRATRIRIHHLSCPSGASIAAKMSWASHRQTSRPEDIAYSLLGLFNVNMPLLYGEGAKKAFQRLQYEIVRLRNDESIFAWSEVADPGDYIPGPGLLAPSPGYFSKSGDIVGIPAWEFGLRAPRTSFDGSVWTLKRNFIRENNQDKRETSLFENRILLVAPLACAKVSKPNAPLKLYFVTPSSNSPPYRQPSSSLEFFNKDEIEKLKKLKMKEYRLVQAPPPTPFETKFTAPFRLGFTLRISESARSLCFEPRGLGQGIQLDGSPEAGEYIISANEEFQNGAGVIMRHKHGVGVKFTCHSFRFGAWSLAMKSDHKEIFVLPASGHRDLQPEGSIRFGDHVIVPLRRSHAISVSPQHGRRKGQDEIVVHIDCHKEPAGGLPNIFRGDLIEEISNDA